MEQSNIFVHWLYIRIVWRYVHWKLTHHLYIFLQKSSPRPSPDSWWDADGEAMEDGGPAARSGWGGRGACFVGGAYFCESKVFRVWRGVTSTSDDLHVDLSTPCIHLYTKRRRWYQSSKSPRLLVARTTQPEASQLNSTSSWRVDRNQLTEKLDYMISMWKSITMDDSKLRSCFRTQSCLHIKLFAREHTRVYWSLPFMTKQCSWWHTKVLIYQCLYWHTKC